MRTRRVAYWLLSVTLLLIPLSPSAALDRTSTGSDERHPFSWADPIHPPCSLMATLAPDRSLVVRPQAVDVKHYKLQIRVTPAPPHIDGTVTIVGETVESVPAIRVDAEENLVVEAVRFNGQAHEFQRDTDEIVLTFSTPLAARQAFTIEVDYHGVPVTSGILGGGMFVSGRGSAPVIATLSEPYAGPSWWPSIDNLADKATVEIQASVPHGLVVASNGVLERVESSGDQLVTYFWRENYPIATYLISLSATNYVVEEDTYTALDGVTTMPLVYYVYPEHQELARRQFAVTRRALEIFAPLFGEYPFLAEKYGMAEVRFSVAGMEHQTITSITETAVHSSDTYVQLLIAHELAHQWWGDWVTPLTWHDIWLNEGFATYAEVLFFERFLNRNPGELMNRRDDGLAYGRMGGTIYAENAADPFDDLGAIYTKGAWVLHMLRHILGDERFFAALKDYGQRLAYANASTADFQRVCEDHYGAPLEWFFQQWIYAPARPIYAVTTTVTAQDSGTYTVTVNLQQQQWHTIPGRVGELARVYIMPLDMTIHYADGSQQTQVVWNNARQQTFSFTVSKPPVRIGVDEGHWVLKELRMN